MRLNQELRDKLTAKPKAALALHHSPDIPTYHAKHGLRHPVASYNISITTIAERVLSVIAELDIVIQKKSFLNPKLLDWQKPLLEATDHMLDALMEHMEDCENIIKSYFEDPRSPEHKETLKLYRQSVYEYRQLIGKIDNYLKHNQGQLRLIIFSAGHEANIGYFVEGPLEMDGVGPIPTIHTGGNTAFSYNRDLRFHLCNLYAISAHLTAALHTVHRGIKPTNKAPKIDKKTTALAQALSRVAELPLVFFPDELAKITPEIIEAPNRFLIRLPAEKSKPTAPPNNSNMQVYYGGDGFTKTYKIPYR